MLGAWRIELFGFTGFQGLLRSSFRGLQGSGGSVPGSSYEIQPYQDRAFVASGWVGILG